MTKRWSSTKSDLTKSKRHASRERRRDLERELLAADADEPEAAFTSFKKMLAWLDEDETQS